MFDRLKSLFGAKPKPRLAPGGPVPSGLRTGAPTAPVPAARAAWAAAAAREIDAGAAAEDLCGLRDGMTRVELADHLADLYRRHNRAASSLDPKLRREAEVMLDAIVECRQKYLAE
jgi:hypothetical protein